MNDSKAMWDAALEYIVKTILENRVHNRVDVNRIKLQAVRKYGLSSTPSNIEILRYLYKLGVEDKRIIDLLRVKPTRSLSGIVIVAVMTAPFECPHGRCIYCPHYPGAPISYTGSEPSSMRGIRNDFDPYRQVINRIMQLESMGHSTDKVEIIIQGGTFNKTPKEYREWYMRRLLQAFIGFYPQDYEAGLYAAERCKRRIVGITFETRPDACRIEDIDWMLERGGTRVELGVQTIYEDVYDYINRGHGIREVVEATLRLKDAGFKVTYHLMPGLPGNDHHDDILMFSKVFTCDNYLPDNVKIYPTLVLEHTGLIKLWRMGIYEPYRDEEAKNIISLMKYNYINPWNRIMRVNRDIPSKEVVDGVKTTNLRQVILEDFKALGIRCRCIRCREAGLRWFKEGLDISGPTLCIRRYYANRGIEFFISVEDLETDTVFGFLRLRKPSIHAWRPEITYSETFIVRELHVYGRSIPIGTGETRGSWQHLGIGKLLLNTAEELVESMGGEKIVIISGVGVREYYYKHGYSRDGPYVSKIIGGPN